MRKTHLIKLFLTVAAMGIFAGCATVPQAGPDYDILRRAEQGQAKISEYDLAASPALDDTLVGRDVSDTTMAASGTTKQYTLSSILALAALDTLADVDICTVDTIPASPSSGDIILITDGDSACDTTTGEGAYVTWHRYDGAAWECIGDGGGTGSSFDQELNTTDDVEFNSGTFGSLSISNSRYTALTAEPTGEAVGDIVVADTDTWNPGSRSGTNDTMYICTATGSPGTWLAIRDMVTGELLLSSFQFPVGANPTVTTEGKAAWETDEDGLRVYDGAENRLIGTTITETYTILQPDLVQAETDDIILAHFDARWYPFGVKMLGYTISASAAISDTILLEEWDDPVGSTQSTSESIALSTASRAEDDGTLTDGDFAADSYLNANLDDTQDDVSWVAITYTYYVKTGD